MSLVSQQQLAQNQLQLKQLENQRNKQVQQSKSLVSSISTAQTNSSEVKKPLSQIYSDPLAITIPTNADPPGLLAARFNSWRIIISALSHYLKETVSVNEEVTRQQIRLNHAISFPFLTQGLNGEFYQPLRIPSQNDQPQQSNSIFHSSSKEHDDLNDKNEIELTRKFFLPLGSGSVQDLPTILYQYHSNAALLAQSTVKELNTTIIPRLEDLKRDLLVKIKEIKSLQSDFKNQVNKYQAETARLLSAYVKAIDLANQDSAQQDPKNDPYIIKFALDRSIRRQLTEENYLHEAFINIQTSGKELEKVVYIELQTALTVYAKLLGQQAQNVFDALISKLDSTILTKEPSIEWDAYVEKDRNNFIDMDLPMRRSSEIKYKHQSNPLTYEIRSGWLDRKTKILKSYQRSWYVLTPSYLHEFKSSDRRKDPLPERSLLLSEITVTEHSRKDEKSPNSFHRFVIAYGQSSGLLHKAHKWVFRAESYDLMMAWYNDLKKVTQLPTAVARAAIAAERKQKSRRSLAASSDYVSSSTATSILSNNRKRGVSTATANTEKTETEHDNSTNLTSLTESSIDGLGNRKSTELAQHVTNVSSADMGFLDNNDVVLVPVNPEALGKAASSAAAAATAGAAIGASTAAVATDSKNQIDLDSLNEQHAALARQQALLEQKRRQLLQEQKELEESAKSLTSTMQLAQLNMQRSQSQLHSSLQQSIPSKSLDSQITTTSTSNTGVEELSEKVGELGVNDSLH
ncbi:hypothetical protein CANINC_002696 [Pichia inconspicua]|uniref:PH domain-containing protein n=1 Tax=Pichia inconspicua TaxID=52247 RepID=A0A4T0X0J2_9ASCO|nr:hypothetical protein CANINC_002696 [[Candida] inconspicua]